MTSPTPAITTFTNGLATTATDMTGVTGNLTNLYNFTMGGFLNRKPLCLLRMTETQQVTQSSLVILGWSLRDIDTNNMFTPHSSTNIGIVTSGIYRLHLQVHYPADATGNVRCCYILLNGFVASTNAIAEDSKPGTADNDGPIVSCSVVTALTAGDILHAAAFHDATGLLNLRPDFGGSRFSAQWLSA